MLQLVLKHRAVAAHLHKLKEYYLGHHDILGDKDRDLKLVCNYAKDIQKTAELQQKIFGGPGIDNTPPEGGEPDANEIDDGDEDGREKPPARGRGIPDE